MGKHKNYGSFYNPQKKEENKVEVSYDNKTEEIATEAEEVTEPVEEEKEVQITLVVVDGAPRVNLREKPYKDAKVLKVVDNGSKFTLLEEHPGWYKISDDTITGYMMSQYLKKV